jgi:hypothetical protein
MTLNSGTTASWFQKNKKPVMLLLVCGAIIVSVGILLAVTTNQTSDNGIVAKINDQVITRQDLEGVVNTRQRFYSAKNQEVDSSTLERDVLETLIDRQLIRTYATDNSIFVSDESVQELYNNRIAQIGSEQELLDYVEQTYGLDQTSYQQQLRDDLQRELVQQSVGQPLNDWLREQRSKATITTYL